MDIIPGRADAVRYSCDVVVVDDYQALTELIVKSLRRSGMVVEGVLDGRGALAIADQCEARVALVDCALPDIDGITLIPQLKARWPNAIFVVISGQVGGLSEAMARQLGVHAFINKPLPMKALCQAVERLVRAHTSGQATGGTAGSWLSLGLGSPREDAAVIRLVTPVQDS